MLILLTETLLPLKFFSGLLLKTKAFIFLSLAFGISSGFLTSLSVVFNLLSHGLLFFFLLLDDGELGLTLLF